VTCGNDDGVDITDDGRPRISGGPADAVLARILSTLGWFALGTLMGGGFGGDSG